MNEEGLVPVESTSSGSAMSSSDGQEEAKECSASYQKLVTNAEHEKPKPKVHDKYSEEDSPTITGFRFFDMEVLSSVFEQLRCGDCGSFSLLLMEYSTMCSGDQHQPSSRREQIAYFGGLLKKTTSDTLNFMVMVTVKASQG